MRQIICLLVFYVIASTCLWGQSQGPVYPTQEEEFYNFFLSSYKQFGYSPEKGSLTEYLNSLDESTRKELLGNIDKELQRFEQVMGDKAGANIMSDTTLSESFKRQLDEKIFPRLMQQTRVTSSDEFGLDGRLSEKERNALDNIMSLHNATVRIFYGLQ